MVYGFWVSRFWIFVFLGSRALWFQYFRVLGF